MSSDTLQDLKNISFAGKSHTQREIGELLVTAMIDILEGQKILLEDDAKPLHQKFNYLTISATPCGAQTNPDMSEFNVDVKKALEQGYEEMDKPSSVIIGSNRNGNCIAIQQMFIRKRGRDETGQNRFYICHGHACDWKTGRLQAR